MNQEIQNLRTAMEAITNRKANQTLLAELRQALPSHVVSEKQSQLIAEKMAQRMRARLDLDEDYPFPSSAIQQLPRIEVSTRMELRDPQGNLQSGLSGWSPKRRIWMIFINGSDHPLRQRFSLMHEYCHVITGTVARDSVSLERFLPSVGTYTSSERLENFCDRFSACLLMPRPLMKRAWAAGHQDVRTLSRLFGVSKMAMRHRLHDLGLAEPIRRHRPYFGGKMYFRSTLQLVDLETSYFHAVLSETPYPRSA